MQDNIWNNENLIKVLKENGVVVMPTDTIYGIVGKALNEDVVNRIYGIKGRNPDKPCIVLIGDMNELVKFSVHPTEEQKKILEEYWPALSEVEGSFDSAQDFQPSPTSIILDCLDDKFAYLHRGTRTLAFRVPASQELRDLLLKTGPLLAPSANMEGVPPSLDIKEAKKYFGDSVNLYIDAGSIVGQASKIIRLEEDGNITIIRS